MPPSKPTTTDEYIATFPEKTQTALQQVRETIRAAAPTDAVECLSYAIPTFDWQGRHLVHFAAFERHIGLYPTPVGMEEFREELAPFKQGKGSVQFPLDQSMPLNLIARIAAFRARVEAEKMALKKAKTKTSKT